MACFPAVKLAGNLGNGSQFRRGFWRMGGFGGWYFACPGPVGETAERSSCHFACPGPVGEKSLGAVVAGVDSPLHWFLRRESIWTLLPVSGRRELFTVVGFSGVHDYSLVSSSKGTRDVLRSCFAILPALRAARSDRRVGRAARSDIVLRVIPLWCSSVKSIGGFGKDRVVEG